MFNNINIVIRRILNSGWRCVESDPPDKDVWALVYADGAMACRAWVNSKQEWEDWQGCTTPGLNIYDITYWKPLPPSPKKLNNIKELLSMFLVSIPIIFIITLFTSINIKNKTIDLYRFLFDFSIVLISLILYSLCINKKNKKYKPKYIHNLK